MAAIFVASYAIEIRRRGSGTETSPLAFAPDKSLRAEILRALGEVEATFIRHEKQPHLLKVKRIQAEGSDIYGIIERGEYGYSSRGVRSDTFVEAFKRAHDVAEMIPFFYRFHLPDDEYTGFMVLQRLGTHSPYTDLRDYLAKSFRSANPDHKLDIGPLVPAKLIQTLNEGKIKTVRLVSHKKTGDPADTFLKGTEARVATVETVYRAPRRFAMWEKQPAVLSDLISGKVKLAKAFPNYDRVVVGVEYNGRTRQFDISDRDDAAPYIEITKDVEREHGHPKFDSINDYSVELIEELRQQLHMGA